MLFPAQSSFAQERAYFAEIPGSRKLAVILAGAAAGEQYAEKYRTWSLALHDALTQEYGYTADRIQLLFDRGDEAEPRIDGPCRRDAILAALSALAADSREGDQIVIVMIGQGTVDGETAKFNVVGPDITGAECAALLDALRGRDVVVVNTTTVSAPFCEALYGPGRVIISATRSPDEKYDTVFPQYFVEALKDRAGDTDKTGRVSMLEAFQYAIHAVGTWYAEKGRLPTEHATLEDNGDGNPSVSPDPAQSDGRLAQIAFLDVAPTAGDTAGTTTRRRELEREIALLRAGKAGMSDADYQARLEALLIELARATLESKPQP